MKSHLKFKIYGEDPSNLFLALLLLKKGFKVEIFKKYNISEKLYYDKLFLISQSTKLILDKHNLWSQISDKAHSIESLSILDRSIFKKLNFSPFHFRSNKTNTNNIGWIINYKDISNLLLNELSQFKNVFSKVTIQQTSEQIYLYKNLKPSLSGNFKNRFESPFSKRNNNSSIEFTASLRGNVDRRLYLLFSGNGPIFLYPINNKLFRVKWIIKNSKLAVTLNYGKSFLLDNISTILPNKLKLDQIMGDVTISSNSPNIFKQLFKSYSYFNIREDSIKEFNFGLEGLDLSFKEVISFYELIKNININNFAFYRLLKFKFIISKIIKFKITSIFFGIFKIDNYFFNYLKFLVFNLLHKVIIFKKFVYKFFIINF